MHVFSDPNRGELHVERHLLQGRSFDVVRARTVDGRTVIARAARFEPAGPTAGASDSDQASAQQWTDALTREAEMAGSECPHLPANPELWNLADTPVPVVVYDFIEGKRLDTWIADRGHAEVTDAEVLTLARGVALALADLHERGFVHRNPGPEHVIVRPDGTPVLIGLANGSRKGGPSCLAKETIDDAYSAPEIQRERSGQFNTPRSDVYAFGMLLAFIATGERPTGEVGSPLTRTAWDRLKARDEGISLIIAKCTQPLQKNRFPSMAKLVPLLSPESLPDKRTEGFGPLALLAPWGRGEPDSLRVGHLSPGPLVDRPREVEPLAAADDTASEGSAEICAPAPVRTQPALPDDEDELPGRALGGLKPMTQPLPVQRSTPWLRWAISAAIIVLALYVAYLNLSR